MSWLDKIKGELTITTGDGKTYSPLYVKPKRSVKFNLKEFEFPDITGALVLRKAAKARRFPVEFIFQGEDHIDESARFETSANDPRPWKISHPYYNDIVVQPVSLGLDDEGLNQTKITGVLVETISEVRPSTEVDPTEKVINDKVAADENLADSYAENVEPDAADINSMTVQTEEIYSDGQSLTTGDIGSEYYNAFQTATAAINNATAEPLRAMRDIQNMISAPARFVSSVKDRINLLESQFNRLVTSIENNLPVSQKRQFEAMGGTVISSMSEAAISGEYQTKTEVLDIADQISLNYATYLSTLDSVQTENGGEPESYIPSSGALTSLQALVSFTISSLFEIALTAQQERVIYLDRPSTPVELTYRFYGLDAEDAALTRFIETNNLHINEYLLIETGRRLVYYV
jgi:hypothetical protein